jgi:hypothetical protein
MEPCGGSGRAGRSAAEVNASGKWAGYQHGLHLKLGPVVSTATIGWAPVCACPANAGGGRSVILDPFAGSGTVGLVAARLGRDAVLVDLNPAYVEMARAKIADDAPLAHDVCVVTPA